MLKTYDFLRPFFSFFGGFWILVFWVLGLFLPPKINFFRSFLEVAILDRFSSVLARFWEGLGRIWGGLGEGFGLIFGSRMMFGGQSEAGMFKKWLGTFVSSFDLVFLDVWG